MPITRNYWLQTLKLQMSEHLDEENIKGAWPNERKIQINVHDGFVSMSTMSQRSHLTNSEAWRVVGRLEGGQTQAEVEQAIGVSQSVISRIWNRCLETGSEGRRPGQGR
ncbi:hypothetical protein TNCV_3344391 [Trichonephila clavipes]|nr:hypothetical protein TNCV_3344391 [Trichonephila clavipes]